MYAVGVAALALAAQWGARGLHVNGPLPAPGNASEQPSNASSSNASGPWRTELKSLAVKVRAACGGAGYVSGCEGVIRQLQEHTREQLMEEAARLQVSAPLVPVIRAKNGDGFHAELSKCVGGGGGSRREVPELAYRHVYKAAGYQIMLNLHRLAYGGQPHLVYNFPGGYYAEFNRRRSALAFTFARNPLARFISGFTEMEEQGWSRPSNFRTGTPERALDFIKGLLLDGFYNGHIAPQVCFHLTHYSYAGRPFDFLGRLEDFEGGWRRLQGMINCSGRLGEWDYGLGGHRSSMRDDMRKAMNDVVGKDLGPDWSKVQKQAEDQRPSAWYSLGIDPHMGLEDAISTYASGTGASMASRHGLAMRDLLLSPGGAALRAVCLLFLADFYALSYPLPSGCEHLDV